MSFEKATIIAAYKRLFLNNLDGKAVLADLAAESMMDSSTFHADPYIAAFNQGKREIVLGLFAKLNVNLVEYLTNAAPEDF